MFLFFLFRLVSLYFSQKNVRRLTNIMLAIVQHMTLHDDKQWSKTMTQKYVNTWSKFGQTGVEKMSDTYQQSC